MNKIRRAHPDDATTLTAIMQACDAYSGHYRAILDGYAVTPEQIGRDHVYVFSDGGRIEGFYSLVDIGECPELDLLFVRNLAKGAGIGSALFLHMLAVAKAGGATRIKIVSHPPALAFYQRMGAVQVGVKPPSGRVTWERPVLDVRV